MEMMCKGSMALGTGCGRCSRCQEDPNQRVVRLFAVPVEDKPETGPKINHDLVDDLKELLAKAESGEIDGAAWVTTGTDGSITRAWSGASGTRYSLGSAILMLQTSYGNALLNKAQPTK